jgi:hypothetical protein
MCAPISQILVRLVARATDGISYLWIKTTKYVSIYNTRTRSNPLALLKKFVTFTGREIRYFLMDNAKEFEEMLTFCRDNGIIIQPVVAYNHTAMCRVESYIGVFKSHGRVGMLNANVPLRFHGNAVLVFCINRNFMLVGFEEDDCRSSY